MGSLGLDKTQAVAPLGGQGENQSETWLRPRQVHIHAAESPAPLDSTTPSHLGCVWKAGLPPQEHPALRAVHEIFVNRTLILHLLKKYYRKSFCKVKNFFVEWTTAPC